MAIYLTINFYKLPTFLVMRISAMQNFSHFHAIQSYCFYIKLVGQKWLRLYVLACNHVCTFGVRCTFINQQGQGKFDPFSSLIKLVCCNVSAIDSSRQIWVVVFDTSLCLSRLGDVMSLPVSFSGGDGVWLMEQGQMVMNSGSHLTVQCTADGRIE